MNIDEKIKQELQADSEKFDFRKCVEVRAQGLSAQVVALGPRT